MSFYEELREILKYVYWSSCKVTAILVRFYRNLDFPARFWKNIEIPNFINIRPVRTEVIHAD